jgi:hypothetical protein
VCQFVATNNFLLKKEREKIPLILYEPNTLRMVEHFVDIDLHNAGPHEETLIVGMILSRKLSTFNKKQFLIKRIYKYFLNKGSNPFFAKI